MRKQLCEVNDDKCILNVRGRTFEWKDLAAMLQKKDTKYSLLYGKYFYGFEKEGKSAYYLENAASGAYFQLSIALREDLLLKGIHKVFNFPVVNAGVLVPEEEKHKDEPEGSEYAETEDTTEAESSIYLIPRDETGTERIERRKKKQFEYEQKRIKADLAQEKMLIEEMSVIRAAMSKQPIILERVKGMHL